MKRAGGALAVWTLLLAFHAAVLWVIFLPGAPKWGYDVLLSIVVPAAAVLGAAAVAAYGRWHRPRREVERAPDLSPSTAIAAIGFALLLIGTEVGGWLVLTGAGLLVIGAGGLARELRAERRAGERR